MDRFLSELIENNVFKIIKIYYKNTDINMRNSKGSWGMRLRIAAWDSASYNKKAVLARGF